MDPTERPLWWGFRPPPRRLSIVELIALGTLDAELAATLWLLVEARVPLVVAAGPPLTGKTALLSALLDFLPPGIDRVAVDGLSAAADSVQHADPDRAVVLVPELSDHLPVYVWGRDARDAIRATTRGIGLATTIHGQRLEEVIAQLAGPPVGLTEDELSYLGVVIVLSVVAPPARRRSGTDRRVVAAHYVRPLARDAGGHIQRLPPAVLATWDPRDDSFAHFEWAIVDELALRARRSTADFAAERARRADFLAGLAASSLVGVDAVRAAIDGYRGGAAHRLHGTSRGR